MAGKVTIARATGSMTEVPECFNNTFPDMHSALLFLQKLFCHPVSVHLPCHLRSKLTETISIFPLISAVPNH